MILERLTITGIDDGVDLVWIDEMISEYPLVEWGVLLSDTRKGSPRYPSDRWLADLTSTFLDKFDDHFSAHLCGTLCDRLIADAGASYLSGELIEHSEPRFFTRVQLNSFPDGTADYVKVNALASNLSHHAEVIVPIPDERVLDRVRHTFHTNVNFLYDPSRGQGIVTNDWPEPHTDNFIGFAGGINVGNVREVLEKFAHHESKRWYWLDLETGARTDDKLDPVKVKEILKIAQEYII